MTDTVLALDFGGTKLAAALVDASTGEWLQTRRAPTPGYSRDGLALMAAMAEEMLSGAQVGAVGVSFGGHVDVRGGIVRGCSIVPGWTNFPLSEWLTSRFNAATHVLNDGTAGALGEHGFGVLAGTANAIYITVSTGVGGGFVVEGQSYPGATGLAGEFGHLPVRNSQIRCKCGKLGCLEAVASGTAIAASARRRLSDRVPSTMQGLAESLSAHDVSLHAERGDRLAKGLLWEAGAAIGEIAAELVTSFDPERIAIGGGVAGAAEPLWTAIQDSFASLTRKSCTATVVPAKHIHDAPLYGALSIALQLVKRHKRVKPHQHSSIPGDFNSAFTRRKRIDSENGETMKCVMYDDLEVLIADEVEEMAETAAASFAASVNTELADKDETSVILALGASQVPFFTSLKAREDIPWSRITIFHVDTYVGVSSENPASGAQRLRRRLLDDVQPKAFFPMLGDRVPLEDELDRYTELLNNYQPQVCMVGIGRTGHLAFNDPPADFRTRDLVKVVALSEITRTDIFANNIFPTYDAVPRFGLTLTMHALLRPKNVMCLLSSAAKAELVREVLEGPVTMMMPASIMRRHANAHLYLTRDAAARLALTSKVRDTVA